MYNSLTPKSIEFHFNYHKTSNVTVQHIKKGHCLIYTDS